MTTVIASAFGVMFWVTVPMLVKLLSLVFVPGLYPALDGAPDLIKWLLIVLLLMVLPYVAIVMYTWQLLGLGFKYLDPGCTDVLMCIVPDSTFGFVAVIAVLAGFVKGFMTGQKLGQRLDDWAGVPAFAKINTWLAVLGTAGCAAAAVKLVQVARRSK